MKIAQQECMGNAKDFIRATAAGISTAHKQAYSYISDKLFS